MQLRTFTWTWYDLIWPSGTDLLLKLSPNFKALRKQRNEMKPGEIKSLRKCYCSFVTLECKGSRMDGRRWWKMALQTARESLIGREAGVSWATFFVQNNSRIPIHIWTCEKRDSGIPFHAGTVIWMVRIKWETGNEKTLFSKAKNLGGIWEFTRDLWFGTYEKCAPVQNLLFWHQTCRREWCPHPTV